ncbi:SDR family NAD(P)-dependent oxidoreductase [Dyella sp. 2RAB6]|uniref:SDR family NAD(P)-dependent oxidoreductase n=1 Tax=Dyella sp. 2RAB6 TaxID=3232992 RepID=UPI003F929F00
MSQLQGKKIAVIGASRGVGRAVTRRVLNEGAEVLAIARGRDGLSQLQASLPKLEVFALDATSEDAPDSLFGVMTPDVVVMSLGAIPPTRPVQDLSWPDFSVNWSTDVKASFLFCKAALQQRLPEGARIILISSGAAVGGSPISGGYAGAKRMQLFLAEYCQREADRLGLDLVFYGLAPARIMPETELGKAAVEGYARYLGMNAADFVEGMTDRQSPEDVADAVVNLAAGARREASAFLVNARGLAAV